MKHFMALITIGQHLLMFLFYKQKLLIWNILQEIKKKKGLHSTFTVDNPKADFERDRATLPTEYLQKIRDKVIEKIL